jgi:phosphoribosylanthranilate isomerase
LQGKKKIEVKICGITKEREIAILNELKPDYAGFVFFEKSKRNISLKEACRLKAKLEHSIKTVAVCVSPTLEFVKQIQEARFDILQVHGALEPEILNQTKIPIWRASNATSMEQMNVMQYADGRICAVVLDSAHAGSGTTFHWDENAAESIRSGLTRSGIRLVLAGGLNPQNVSEGIQIFLPDVVDVSTGVENDTGKDREKIEQFLKEVRK